MRTPDPISRRNRLLNPAVEASRGVGIPTVMMMAALMLTLSFTVVGIAFNHLNLSFKSSNQIKAEHLAESVLALAVERFAASDGENFGVGGSTSDRTLTVAFDSLPAGSLGVLTFDQSYARDRGMPYSTNNRTENSVEGFAGTVVPGQTVHLVARGNVAGSTSTMEAFLNVPRFPYSVASGGAIRSTGGLVVASVKPGVAYDLNAPLHEDDLLPAHVLSNNLAMGPSAIDLEGENRIYGDLQSAAGVTVSEDTIVFGEIRPNADQMDLNKQQAQDYDPEFKVPAVEFDTIQTTQLATLEVKGYNKVPGGQVPGGLKVDNGIRLNGGVLYVDGDLTVSAGGISGKGAIITTGNLEIVGGGEAASDNLAALVADGDITLKGSPGNKAKFSGLVYTNGNLNSEHLRLAGVFVAAGSESNVDFKDTELYHVEEYSKIELREEFRLENVAPPPSGLEIEGVQYNIEASFDLSVFHDRLPTFLDPEAGSGEARYLIKAANAGSSTGYYTYQDQNGEVVLVETSGPDQHVLTGDDLGLRIYGERITTAAQAETAALSGLEQRLAADGKTLSDQDRINARGLARRLFEAGQASLSASQQATFFNMQQTVDGEPGSSPVSETIDLSEFFSRSDVVRVLYWGRYTTDER